MEEKAVRYEKIKFLGEGQFATVYKAFDNVTGKIVAIKKFKDPNDGSKKNGVHVCTLREIKFLRELQHPNIIRLVDIFTQRTDISLVLELMESDLETIIKDPKIIFSVANIKSYMIMTLRGVEYLHMNWILHRDLKPNNLLINCDGVLKINDFGLAKSYGSPSVVYTSQVVTRWYRAPELLFGAKKYGTNIDIWAVGCILAELLLRLPFFPGDSDLDQLTKIFQIRGTPNDELWPNVAKLPGFIKFKIFEPVSLYDIFSAAPDDLITLIEIMLALNPLQRCTASEALQMPFFTNAPAPTAASELPMPMANDKDGAKQPTAKQRKLSGSENGGGNPTAKKLEF